MFKRLLFFLFVCSSSFGQGGYFGQNKTRNRVNEFDILRSEHFDLYHYLKDTSLTQAFLRNSEQWYRNHQKVFKMAFISPNPLIVYKTHPDFQETTVVRGQISAATGGVTEGFKTRVVMPLFFTKKQTNHVLGHELVHVFQYQTMTYGSDSTSLKNISNIPLFMTEGLAEYLSLGRNDPHTSLWMRDAVLNDDVPSIEDLVLKQDKYFPYRWGHAFWAYVTGLYGDEIIRPLYKQTAIYGIREAFVKIFKMDIELFSSRFKNDIKLYYNHFKGNRLTDVWGRTIAFSDAGKKINITPSLSHDGKYLAYVSSKDELSMNLYVIEHEKGNVICSISADGFGSHIDSYSFLESSISWSPNGREVALVVQSKGTNKLLILDVFSKETKEYTFKDIDAISSPSWSPLGQEIVVAGLKEGRSDLFVLDLKSEKIRKLTDDIYSDIQPTWSPDGKFVFFVSDRGGEVGNLEKEALKIAKINIETSDVTVLPLFIDSDNFNPQLAPNGQYLYFLSSPDGFRDIYKLDLYSMEISRITNFFTGVTGITLYSPAVSVAQKSGDLAYSYLNEAGYSIVFLPGSHLEKSLHEVVLKNTGAGILSPGRITQGDDIVQSGLGKSSYSVTKFEPVKYESKFKLDYIANSGLSMGLSRFGAGMTGGVTALFSDMLNNNQFSASVALNGELEDLGGQLSYINQKNPWQFGFTLGHITYRMYGGYSTHTGVDTLKSSGDLVYVNGILKERIVRLYINQLSAFVLRPLSRQTRVEFGANLNLYSYSAKAYARDGVLTYDKNGELVDFKGSQTRFNSEKISPKEVDSLFRPFKTFQVFTALVGDNTTFGEVAPANGYRYRLEAAQFFGTVNYTHLLADLRRYVYLKPVTLAGRFYFEGRFNSRNTDNLNRIYPLYLGYPWYIHGLDRNMFLGSLTNINSSGPYAGDQLALTNLELRLPFTGNRKSTLLPLGFVSSDLNVFLDAGLTWSKERQKGETVQQKIKASRPVASTGVSLRLNLLNYLVLEPYVAFPFGQNINKGKVSGINFMIGAW